MIFRKNVCLFVMFLMSNVRGYVYWEGETGIANLLEIENADRYLTKYTAGQNKLIKEATFYDSRSV